MKDFKLGVILGSGIEIESERITNAIVLDKSKAGVHNRLVYSCLFDGFPLLVFSGRKHFYDGFNAGQLAENVNFSFKAGVKNLLVTNAAGGVNENFGVSDLMLINSHINLNSSVRNMHGHFPYSRGLAELFSNGCKSAGVKLYEGVYGCYQGPTYETKAEIRFQKKYKIDAAGMSTVPEVSMAKLLGIRIIAVSVITNILKENAAETASHQSVLYNAKIASEKLNKVLSAFIPQLN